MNYNQYEDRWEMEYRNYYIYHEIIGQKIYHFIDMLIEKEGR